MTRQLAPSAVVLRSFCRVATKWVAPDLPLLGVPADAARVGGRLLQPLPRVAAAAALRPAALLPPELGAAVLLLLVVAAPAAAIVSLSVVVRVKVGTQIKPFLQLI